MLGARSLAVSVAVALLARSAAAEACVVPEHLALLARQEGLFISCDDPMQRTAPSLEEGEKEEEKGSIFALPDLDFSRKMMLSLMIMGLIIVTIVYERVTEYFEENVFTGGISEMLFQKMIRELAILGFVSFTATVLKQFLQTVPESDLQLFEYAHVLLFTTACAYVKEIALVSRQLHAIEVDFERMGQVDDAEVLRAERELWFGEGASRWRGAFGFLRYRTSAVASHSTFKVLRFAFMAQTHLLGKQNFSWQTYVTRSMYRQIEEMIEVQSSTWFATFAVVGATLPIEVPQLPALLFFAGGGWLLLLLGVGVLFETNFMVSSLVKQGHRRRLRAKRTYTSVPDDPLLEFSRQQTTKHLLAASRQSSGDGGGGVDDMAAGAAAAVPRIARVRMYELSSSVQVHKSHQLMAQLAAGFKAIETEGSEGVGDTDSGGLAEPSAREKLDVANEMLGRVRRGVKIVPFALQLLLLLQCLLQSLLLTMLGRNAVLYLSLPEEGDDGHAEHDAVDARGAGLGSLLIALTLMPTLLMSFLVTPRVLKNFALAYATACRQTEVLQQMETEFERSGDYAAASQALELTMSSKLSDDDLLDGEVVRAKVRDMVKLGEMRWRYRVVDEGQNPRDEAIAVLDEAKSVVEAHIAALVEQRALTTSSEAVTHQLRQDLRQEWAPELSEVCQGLAVARLIFNTDRAEDALILELLKEALELREGARLTDKMADTLNSLGTLRQRQKRYQDAEGYFTKSLELRRTMKLRDDKGRVLQAEAAQAQAQSLTSLGTLYVEMGDAQKSKEGGGGGAAAAAPLYDQALRHMQQAKEQYIAGFSDTHPKVAWALEGMAKAHLKRGNLREAQLAFEEAIAVRRSLQDGGGGKQLFSKELETAEAEVSSITSRREAARGRFAKPFSAMLAVKRVSNGDAGPSSSGLDEESSVGWAQPLLADAPRPPAEGEQPPAGSSAGPTPARD